MTNILKIPKRNGRPLILFPDGWKHGWLDPNAELVLDSSTQEWAEWLRDYELGILVPPFGSDDITGQWFSPWGIAFHGMPRLHPDDL